jgi:hypothetical protein
VNCSYDLDNFTTTAPYDMTNTCVSQVLPVKFGQVNAILKRGTLSVTWATATEVNNSHFDVEISDDGQKFTTIGTLHSKAPDGNSSATILYEFSLPISAGQAYSGMGILGLLSALLLGKRRKLAMSLLVITGVGLLAIYAVSCSRNTTTEINSNTKNHFIRIVQVDKNGTKAYSKVVKVVGE